MTQEAVTSPSHDVQLTHVFLDRVQLENYQDLAPISPGTPVKWAVDSTAGWRLSSPNEVRLRLSATITYEDGSPKPFDLTVDLIGICQSETEILEDRAHELVQTHAIRLLWPYLRETISSLAQRAGGPTMLIPTLRITSLRADPQRRRATAMRPSITRPSSIDRESGKKHSDSARRLTPPQ